MTLRVCDICLVCPVCRHRSEPMPTAHPLPDHCHVQVGCPKCKSMFLMTINNTLFRPVCMN